MNKSEQAPRIRSRKRKASYYLPRTLLVLLGMGLLVWLILGILWSAGLPVPQVAAVSTPQTDGQQQTSADAVSADDWELTLVNRWTPLPEEYGVTLAKLPDGHSVDERCYPYLQSMLEDCRAAGLSPLICSSYRTHEKQERLFQNEVDKLRSRGYAREAAKTEAGKAVAVPGTSEHQLGLAVDIVDLSNQNLNESQEDTPVQQWLLENSWKYGFILRYPNEKSEITGIIYEPWHYRYVGKPAAQQIYEQGVCLEEYLSQLQA